MNYDEEYRKEFKYYYERLKNQSCFYPEAIKFYLISTIKDILSDYEKELADEELFELCFKVYREYLFSEIDNKIQKIVEEELNLTEGGNKIWNQ